MAQAVKALGYFRENGRPGRSRTARVDSDADDGADSVVEQNRAFLEFCRREGYALSATFIDHSGDAERSGFQQLLEHLKRNSGTPHVVVVTSIDRLGADPMQAARSLFQIDVLGGKVISLDGAADPASALIEQWGRKGPPVDVGQRVREAMRKKAIRGEVLGRPPYGYRVGPKSRLEPVPDEANLVRYIFRLYTRDGLGIRLIARRLNEEGFRTRKGGNWSMITLRDILLNRAYLGTYTRFGVRVPGSHPALISPEDFRRVQDRMASRRTGGGERHVRQFLVSGLAYCGYCGNRMIGVSRRQSWYRRDEEGRPEAAEAEYRYYQCLSRTNQSMCDYHTWRAADLEEEVRRRAVDAVEQSLSLPTTFEGGGTSVEEEVERLRGRLRQLDRRLEQYLQAAANREMTLQRMRELSVEVTQEQMQTDEAIKQLEDRRQAVESLSEQRKARAALLAGLRDRWDELEFEQRQALIREVVDRVTVLDDSVELRLRS